jgi:hypothetical protein
MGLELSYAQFSGPQAKLTVVEDKPFCQDTSVHDSLADGLVIGLGKIGQQGPLKDVPISRLEPDSTNSWSVTDCWSAHSKWPY